METKFTCSAEYKYLRYLFAMAAAGCLAAASVKAEEALSCDDRVAETWLAEAFGPTPPDAGRLKGRQRLEAPAWLRGATISGAKYAISLLREPGGGDVALSDLTIGPLASSDSYGAAIRVFDRDGSGLEDDSPMRLFLNNIEIAPNWPDWISYKETNYDGIDFAAPGEIYGHAVRIRDWNADAALDIKADRSQFVDLEVSGAGNRPLRYWRAGPHYLVASDISRPDEGPLLWFADCTSSTLRVFDTRFNDSDRLPLDLVSCEVGEAPVIIYLSEDPRESGDIHPMLRGCPSGD